MEARAEINIPQAQPYENLIKNEQNRDFRKSSTTAGMVCFVCLFCCWFFLHTYIKKHFTLNLSTKSEENVRFWNSQPLKQQILTSMCNFRYKTEYTRKDQWSWRGAMDCHATARRSREMCLNRVSRPSQGIANGSAVSKWPRCRWDGVKHN